MIEEINEPVEVPNVLSVLGQKLPEIYYESSKGYFWVKDDRGRWIVINETAVKRELINTGLPRKPLAGDCISQVDKELRRIMLWQGVDYAGPVAGYNSGLQTMLGNRILVTESPVLYPVKYGDWKILERFIECVIGEFHPQTIYLYGWLQVALESLMSGKFRPGQALIMAGPKDCGKSLLQNQFTRLLGGRVAKPYEWLTGKTNFNGDLLGAEHLAIEDEVSVTNFQSRRALGASLKNILVNTVQRCHPKGKQAMSMTPFWRISISVNDEAEHLMVLPPQDPSTWDKLMMLRASMNEFPMPTQSVQERADFEGALIEGFPGLQDYLLNVFKIPKEYQDPRRFGVATYHDPYLLEVVGNESPEIRLLNIIDEIHFSTSDEPLTGTAERLQIALADWESGKREIDRLLNWQGAMKTYLKRLLICCPDRVSMAGFGHNKSAKWIISPPPPLESEDA